MRIRKTNVDNGVSYLIKPQQFLKDLFRVFVSDRLVRERYHALLNSDGHMTVHTESYTYRKETKR